MDFPKIVDKIIGALFVLILLGVLVLLGILITWSIKMVF